MKYNFTLLRNVVSCQRQLFNTYIKVFFRIAGLIEIFFGVTVTDSKYKNKAE